MTTEDRALAIATKCAEAYSADRYTSWALVARRLLGLGYTDLETERIMRSKITRWAADRYGRDYGKAPAIAVVKFIREYPDDVRRILKEWAE